MFDVVSKDAPLPDTVAQRVKAGRDAMKSELTYWAADWKLYRSYIDMSGRDRRRSNAFIPMVFPLIETAAARYVLGIMGADPIVSVMPQTREDYEASFGMELAFQYHMERMPLYPKISEIARTLLIWGDAFSLHSWRTERKIQTKTMRQDFLGVQLPPVTVETEVTIYDGPDWEIFQPWQLYGDPYYHTIDRGWKIVEDWVSRDDLKDLEDQGKVYDVDKIPDSSSDISGKDSDTYRFWKEVGFETPEGDRNMVLRHRMFEPSGRWVTIANGIVIFEDSNPHDHGLIPLAQWPKIPNVKRLYSTSAVRQVARTQHQFNTQFDQAMDRNNMTLHPMIAYNTNSGLDPYRLISEPNNFVPVEGNPSEALYVHKVPELTGSVLEMMNFLKGSFDETSGYFGLQRGADSPTDKASLGQILNNQGDMRIRFDVDTMTEYGMTRAARLTGSDIQQFMTEEVQLSITKNGQRLFPVVTPDQIRGSFMYRLLGPTQVWNRQADRAQIIEIYNLIANNPQLNQAGMLEVVCDMFPSLRAAKDKILMQSNPMMDPMAGGMGGATASVGATSSLQNPQTLAPPQNEGQALQAVKRG